MKTLGSILFTILIAFGVTLAQEDKKPEDKSQTKAAKSIVTKFDKSKNLTTVRLKSMDLGGAMNKEVTAESQIPQLTFDAFFTFAGEQKSQPIDSATFRFTVRAKFPVYKHGENLMAVLDDATAVPLGSTSYKTNAQTFYTDEILEAVLPNEVMQRIAQAKTLKLYLGTREIPFRTDQFNSLRELAARMAN